jgi:hypothetical protein
VTRLRHLAIHGDAEVHGRVIAAMKSLAEEPHLRTSTLREVIRWTADDGRLKAAGIRTFLVLTEAGSPVIPRTLSERERIDLLAAGWRATFHDAEHTPEARAACVEWLEAAAQGMAPRDVVIAMITRSCQNSYDIGVLAPAIWQWAQTAERLTPYPRSDIYTELMQQLAYRDPLAPGVSPATIYSETRENGA